jgi:hypothetical protein
MAQALGGLQRDAALAGQKPAQDRLRHMRLLGDGKDGFAGAEDFTAEHFD